MKRLSRLALVVLVLVAAGAAGYWTNRHAGYVTPRIAASGATSSQTGTVAPETGERLLALTLPDAQGAPVTLADWRGDVIVVNFWATWCPPCKREIPDFIEVYEQHRAQGVRFVGLSIDTPENVAAFAEQIGVTYPLLIGTADTLQLASALGNPAQGLPFTVILDRRGMIRHITLGTMSKDDLAEKIGALAS